MLVTGGGCQSAAARGAARPSGNFHTLSYIPGVQACRTATSEWELQVLQATITGTGFPLASLGSVSVLLTAGQPSSKSSFTSLKLAEAR